MTVQKHQALILTAVLMTGVASGAEAAVESVSTATTIQNSTESKLTAIAQPSASTLAAGSRSTGDAKTPLQDTARSSPDIPFSSEQESRIGELARDYLLMHPEVLMEVSQKLRKQQQMAQLDAMKNAVLRHQEGLLDDTTTPTLGPADAKVAVVEFFDYQCAVCSRQASTIGALINANPQVRFVFKEWPIFAQRWETSLTAAKTGLRIWKQKGADAYLTYHNALFATGHTEGKLTPGDVKKAATDAGRLKGNDQTWLDELSAVDALAQNIGFRGTPGIIVMPVNGATKDNVTIIPGEADENTLQQIIDNTLKAL